MKKLIIIFACVFSFYARAQFHPPAGQPGTSAMRYDSAAFVNWATTCTVVRGYEDITNMAGPFASTGTDANATGQADGINVVSLGDAGTATLSFASTLYDGPGYDFAVFENSFSDVFLELAFVEVSSDGINFFRFPATSFTQDTVQTGSFGSTDATQLNNLAGKYRAQYGTPFDLTELNGTPGLDLMHVSHIRLIDVVGKIESPYSSFDQYNHTVNDPWPTAFPSGGFDLDAVGAIHMNPMGVAENNPQPWKVYPQPATEELFITGTENANLKVQLLDVSGKMIPVTVHQQSGISHIRWNTIPAGLYVLLLGDENNNASYRIIIQ